MSSLLSENKINKTFWWASKTECISPRLSSNKSPLKMDLFIFDWSHSHVKDTKWTRPSRRLLVYSDQKARAAPPPWLCLTQIDYCAFCDNYWFHFPLGLPLQHVCSRTAHKSTDHFLYPRHHTGHWRHRDNWTPKESGPGGVWTMMWGALGKVARELGAPWGID